MSQLLTLSRAARLVGVSRSALQKKIHDDELPSFDGMVKAEDLLKVYPDARLDVDEAFERITHIKEQAFGRRVRERTLPSQEILAERLFHQGQELADLRLHLQRYHGMVVQLAAQIEALAAAREPIAPAAVAELGASLDQALQGVLGAPGEASAIEIMDDMLRVMSAHVTIQPSGHEFFVEGVDTILEGGLKAGLALSYGCSGGTCGLCKTRVVSGQVRKLRHHDYVFTEAEKQCGYTLACSYVPVSDVVLEAIEAAGPGDIPEQQIVARVKRLEALSPDVWLLHLQTPRSQRLRFIAGQRVVLGFHPGGNAEFPVASCPCDDRNLQFHVRRDPDSTFAEHLIGGWLKPGDAVSVLGPWGEFVLREGNGRPLVFIAGDTGFAPVKSLIEHAVTLDVFPHIHLLWQASREDGHYLDNLCRAWGEALDEFTYTLLPAEADLGRSLREGVPTFREADIYVAGPEGFVASALATLVEAGVVRSRIVESVVN